METEIVTMDNILTLPITGHVVELNDELTYGQELELNETLYEGLNLEQGGGEKSTSISGKVLIKHLKKQLTLLVKNVTLATDVEGVGKLGEKVEATEKFLMSLPRKDGKMLQEAVQTLYNDEKKS